VAKVALIVPATMVATELLRATYGEESVVVAMAALIAAFLVFAEILPRAIASRHPQRAALAVAPLVRALVALVWPFARAIEWAGTGGRTGPQQAPGTEADAQSTEEDAAAPFHRSTVDAGEIREERAMLRSVRELGRVVVGAVMTHRRNVVMIDADEPVEAIVAQVLASPFTRFPIWRGEIDNVVGVIHVKALLRAVQGRHGAVYGLDVVSLSAKPWYVPDSTSLLDQLQAFRRRREHFALVVDEYGSLMGIVTLEDILEEIVGDIADEHDIALPGVFRQPDGSLMVQGSVTIRDLNRELEWRLPDDRAVTVAGLLLHEARRIPDIGQAFKFHGMRFEILRKHRHQITSIRIRPTTDAETSTASKAQA
jgi:Mg2+/Co2+ transporter CorB